MIAKILESFMASGSTLGKVVMLCSLVDQPLKNKKNWDDIDLETIQDMDIQPHDAMGWLSEDYEFEIIKNNLQEKIKNLPIIKIIDQKNGHDSAFFQVLDGIIKDIETEHSLQDLRFMILCVLILVLDMDEGEISQNKSRFIQEVARRFGVEDDVLDELLGQAQAGYQWLRKTLNILLD